MAWRGTFFCGVVQIRYICGMIKNLLFDLGGVIMDIDRSLCVDALRGLGMADADEFLGVYRQKGPFLDLESGALSAAGFRDAVRRMCGSAVSDVAIDEALCRFLIGIPVARLRRIAELRRTYRIYMLSNTNPIMWERFIVPEFTKDGHDIDYYFDGIVTSFETGECKPSPVIYRRAIDRFGINPEETLFYDDGLANVEAARAFGFHAVKVDAPDKPYGDYLMEL